MPRPAALATSGEIGAHHATAHAGERGCEIIEVAALPAQAMHAQHGNVGLRGAPIDIRDVMEAAKRKPQHRSGAIRPELLLFFLFLTPAVAGMSGRDCAHDQDCDCPARKACASDHVSNTCGARLRSASPAPSLRRMNALVVYRE